MDHGSALIYSPELSLLWYPSSRRGWRKSTQQTSSRSIFVETLYKLCWKPIKLTCLPLMTSNHNISLHYWVTGKSRLMKQARLNLQNGLIIYLRCYVEQVLENLTNQHYRETQPTTVLPHHGGFIWVISLHKCTFQAEICIEARNA